MMKWLTDERLFYVGIILIIIALVLLIVYICISNFAMTRLKRQLRKEYGEIVKVRSK